MAEDAAAARAAGHRRGQAPRSSRAAALRGCLCRPARRRAQAHAGSRGDRRGQRRGSETAVEAVGLTKRFGDFTAADNISFRHQPRRNLRPARAQRRRQIDHVQDDVRPAAAHGRHGPRGRLRPVRAPAAARGALGYMAQKFSLYGDLSVRAEPRLLRRRLWPAGAPAREAIDRADRRLRSRARISTPTRASCRWASSSGWRWPARSCTTRRCCFWTSRPPASIR